MAVFTVTTDTDTVDANDGVTSLREALTLANGNTGADKIIFAGYWAAGLTLDRIHAELPGVPFRDHVWAKFLHGNADRVFGEAGVG